MKTFREDFEEIKEEFLRPFKPDKQDKFTKGLTLPIEYQKDWDIIKEITAKYDVDQMIFGCAITISYRRIAEIIDETVDKLMKEKSLLEKLQVGLMPDWNTYERKISSILFSTLLCSFPSFCISSSGEGFIDFMTDKKNEKHLIDLINMRGTVKTTDKDMRGLVDEMMIELKG